MNKLIKNLILPIILLSLFIMPALVLAQDEAPATVSQTQILDKLSSVGTKSGYNLTVSPPEIIGFIIGAFINFLGLAFLVLVVVAGYGWMTAGGNEEKVKKAVTTLKEAVIGLVLTISAWTLWNFVLESLIFKG